MITVRSSAAMAGMALLGMISVPSRGDTQHQHGEQMSGVGDTLATAPIKPSRPATDSARVADSLLRTCRPHEKHSLDMYAGCIASGLSALSAAGNIALALGTLDRVMHDEPSLTLVVHPLAHALGYAVPSTPSTVSLLLAQCDDRYQSGCYHGILQRYFATRMGMPLAQRVLTAPCDPFRGNSGHFRLFACLHGTGHGLMMYHRYDFRAALPDCDRLTADWDRSSCYGGVFMEHNMGARMQAFGEGEGLHRHSAPSSAVTLYKPGDLHYPCNATRERYRRECYSLQADIILPALKHDYARAAKVCDAAGAAALVRACYRGLGRNAAGGATSKFKEIIVRCGSGSLAGGPFCYEGAVRQLAYAASELPRGVAFCRAIPASEPRMRCWGGLGLQISGFFVDTAARRRACQSERPADVEACFNGAGVGRLGRTNDDV